MTSEYEIRPLDASDEGLRDCEQLLRRVFPHAPYLTKKYLDWQYNRNPAGAAIGFNAYHGTTLAAHYVTIPVAARIDGETRSGVLSLNTATHPDHQGKKLFTVLAERTYEAASSRGHVFVVGVGNTKSTPGLVKNLGFQFVGPLEARLGFGKPRREDDTRIVKFERIWDRESLRWRLANPSRSYRIVSEHSRFRVEAPTERPGIKTLLGEFDASLCPDGIGAEGLGFRPITLWIGIDTRIRWSRSLYWEIPKRFRRSPLNLVVKPFRSSELSLRREEVRFQALDFDVY